MIIMTSNTICEKYSSIYTNYDKSIIWITSTGFSNLLRISVWSLTEVILVTPGTRHT